MSARGWEPCERTHPHLPHAWDQSRKGCPGVPEPPAAKRQEWTLGNLQGYLQGMPTASTNWQPRHRPWIVWKLGNLLSDLRYWSWRLTGGSHDDPDW